MATDKIEEVFMRQDVKHNDAAGRTRGYVLGSQVLKDLALITKSTDLPETKLGLVFRVNSKTISRWRNKEVKNIKPEHSLVVRRFKELVILGLKVFNKAGMLEFLVNPQPVFGNKSAFDMLIIGEFEKVESVLASMYEGASL